MATASQQQKWRKKTAVLEEARRALPGCEMVREPLVMRVDGWLAVYEWDGKEWVRLGVVQVDTPEASAEG